MAKYRKIDEAISRRSLNWLENYLMDSIEQDYEKIMSGEVSLLSICKDAVEYSKYNHIYFNTREDREQIYQMARECLSRVEDYMAEQKGFANDDEDEFPSHTNESKNRNNMKNTVRITEGQLKQMISESVRRVLNEIGDTNAGLATIRKAQTKAEMLGRDKQGIRFKQYADNIDGGNIRAINDYNIVFINSEGGRVVINTKGEITTNEQYAGNISFASRIVKVSNPRVARIIAKWVGEHVEGCSHDCADWHRYMAQ